MSKARKWVWWRLMTFVVIVCSPACDNDKDRPSNQIDNVAEMQVGGRIVDTPTDFLDDTSVLSPPIVDPPLLRN